MRKWSLAFRFMWIAACAAHGQVASGPVGATIVGSVLGSGNRPLPGVAVEIVSFGHTITDSAGAFRFEAIPVGQWLVRATKLGFRPSLKMVPTAAGDTIRVSIALESAAQELGPVVVNADSTYSALTDPSGFEQRRRRATGGIFIVASDIAKKHLVETEQIFHGLPFVTVDTGGIVVIKRGEISLRDIYLTGKDVNQFNMCIGAQVIVDGVLMPQPFNVNSVELRRIRAIEIYTGLASTPASLRGPKTVCGTVAIWSK